MAKKGNIWLGGRDGLYHYDGIEFNNITKSFVGSIYEDKIGNIWTNSQSVKGCTLSRYEIKSSDNELGNVTEVNTGEAMLFGILEDSEGNIWSGTVDGVHCYDGNTITDFKSKEGKE